MNNVTDLLKQPIWQMSGEQFLELVSMQNNQSPQIHEQKLIYGVNELSKFLGCCPATIYTLKKQGILDDAIVSRIGKKIVFNGDKALEIAQEYFKREHVGTYAEK